MPAVPAGPIRFSARIDPVKTASARRWNAGFIATGGVLLAASLAGLAAILVSGFGSWFTVGLVAVFGIATIGLLVTSVLRGRMLRLMLAPGAPAVVVTETGIAAGGIPEIAWSEIAFVEVLNDRPRTNRLRRVPIFGWAGSLALKAGNGTILCELGVRDGEALRARIHAPAVAKRVGLYGRWPDGTRRGLVPLLLDAVLAEENTEAVVRVLFAECASREIPYALFEQTFAATKWKGPLLDPGWPSEIV